MTVTELENLQEAVVLAFKFPIELSLAVLLLMMLLITVLILFAPGKRHDQS